MPLQQLIPDRKIFDVREGHTDKNSISTLHITISRVGDPCATFRFVPPTRQSSCWVQKLRSRVQLSTKIFPFGGNQLGCLAQSEEEGQGASKTKHHIANLLGYAYAQCSKL
jgi:hypothetical protein